MINYLRNKNFLKQLDNSNNKFYLVKIEILDSDENLIQSIEGRVQSGSSISINGSSPIRRTCNITFIATEDKNDLKNINGLLSINKRIRIKIGFENNIDNKYDKIVWFPLGIFIINQPSISNSSNGCLISLSCKDKMCLLDGSCGGGFPTTITFDNYDQVIGTRELDQDPTTIIWINKTTGERLYPDFPNDYTVYIYNDKYYYWTKKQGWSQYTSLETARNVIGKTVTIKQRFYDIIQTVVHNYGGIPISKIFINDVPLEIKQLVRWTNSTPLYYIYETKQYTTNRNDIAGKEEGTFREFKYNEDIGYQYTDFIYPDTLVSSIGENVCSILNKIKTKLGNYEFFFDVEGNFIFQEIKNYLNTSYSNSDMSRLDNQGQQGKNIYDNELAMLDNSNYELDIYNNNKSVYTFSEGNGLILSYQNNPDYTNIKNDFHIWGSTAKDKGIAIHYHVAIKEKPIEYENNSYQVIFLKKNGLFTGGLRLLGAGETTSGLKSDEYDNDYHPADWRAALYLNGLAKQKEQIRPDIYEQELLDLFDSIYDFRLKKFKTDDIINNPNQLTYWFDYMEPVEGFYPCSVDNLGTKIYSYQEDKINKLFTCYVPNNILLNTQMDRQEFERLRQKCYYQGQSFSNVNDSINKGIAEGTSGYTAQDTAREFLYQYTNFNESISIQCVPIYYLDVNTRITVQDDRSGIYGDYIINNISLPLSAEGTMNITAGKALERI